MNFKYIYEIKKNHPICEWFKKLICVGYDDFLPSETTKQNTVTSSLYFYFQSKYIKYVL